MLTAPEQAAFLASVQGVRRRMATVLKTAGSAERAVGFVAQLHTALDAVAVRAAAAGPAPDCQAGCAHCCRLPVQATEPELLRIARMVSRWPNTAQVDLRARLQAHAPGQACAFLQGERCTVYEARPGACRKAHSLSVAACEAREAQVPQNLAWIVDAEALICGTAAAYQDAALPSSAQELNRGVLTALSADEAEGRWFAGEVLFDAPATPTGLP